MSNTQIHTAKEDGEIDLIELFSVLWKKKLWIILSAFVFTALAGAYAFTAKEQWTSKTEVIAPKLEDLGDYFSIRKEYARILGGEFDLGAFSNGLFGKFNLYTESLDKRREFFEQSDLYKQLSESASEQEKIKTLSDLITKNITITKPDPKKEPDLIGRRISFFAETPISAQETLNQFVLFNSQLAYQEDVNDFLIAFNEQIEDLKYEKSKFERDLKIQKTVQLDNLQKALSIAKEAGIKEYTKSFNSTNEAVLQGVALNDAKIPLSDSKLSDSTYLFMLGEKYLKAQIDVVSQTDIVYPPRYYVVTELLSELEPLLEKTKTAKAQAFSYQASPDYPVVKDKPKRVIILVIGFLIGMLLMIAYLYSVRLFKKD
ncbi:LPS O-antigen chain length determinant protein WzzB [Caviibacterium pharyngocola]|uniref:Chain length determination protein n=1 Tax=Caviibacterium pharyngocola TaxID=28159 RepID=A0A2M8RX89_9PAST|nr:Wzz/FepE/Etk N-terminal domain-containing protein [Caviibacterium pharyngocola]PJG83513.1 chain length determination protein [Caviibacterium pharyngocola]